MSIRDRIEQISKRDLDARAMRAAMLDQIRRRVPFDFYAWLLTDPDTTVGCAPLAEVPSLAELPTVIRLKYQTPTNRWTSMPFNTATTLAEATAGQPGPSLPWQQLLHSYGVDDVLSIAFGDQHGCWGFLDLWRVGRTFAVSDCAVLDDIAPQVASSLRACQLPTFDGGSVPVARRAGPAVMLLSNELLMVSQTAQTEVLLRALLPTAPERSPVPAAALNVVAQLLAQEAGVDGHPPSARVHVRDGSWVTLRAARIESATEPSTGTIAVSIELTSPAERTSLYARVAGLSERESEVLRHLVGGSDTRQLAQSLFVSEHTVQDHLKSIFAKAGVNSRRMLTARATGLA